MATLDSARQKWERKTASAGENWARNAKGKGSEYAAGVARFLGTPPSGRVVSSYESGVNAVSAADFQSSVQGKGGKWAENTRRGLTQ